MSSKRILLYISKIYRTYFSPYNYVAKNYEIQFLNRKREKSPFHQTANKVIYCFWTGNNPMSENRTHGIECIKNNSDIPVILITPNNLHKYVLEEYPLHHAYEYLSNVHKSDYLRCYFMHHLGGGYSDVKPHYKSWSSSFDNLNKDSTKFCIGYPEKRPEDIGYIANFFSSKEVDKINKDMRNYYFTLIGNCSYIFKPNTEFTKLWITELHRRLDLAYEDLKQNPGNIMGDNEGYPLKWTSILGEIFHPLCLIFKDEILLDPSLRPYLKNYR